MSFQNSSPWQQLRFVATFTCLAFSKVASPRKTFTLIKL
jgi:hypothetical protein